MRLPEAADLAGIHQNFLGPLQQLRPVPHCDRWWLDPAVIRLATASLGCNGFVVIDGFLSEADFGEMRATAQRLWQTGEMRPGIEEQKGSFGGYWGDGNEGDFQNLEGDKRKWSMEGDLRAWIGENDARAPRMWLLTSATDAIVTALKSDQCLTESWWSGHTANTAVRSDHGVSKVRERMHHVDFRESTMVSCYPGEARAKYLRHCDTGRGAIITALFYLNQNWSPDDGGVLRLYEEGFHNTQVKCDVLPVGNRLLLFWSNDECPHEVLPTLRNRFAMTTWYRDCSTPGDIATLVETMARCLPVAPLSMEEAVRRAGPPKGQDKRLKTLQKLRHAISQPEHLQTALLQELMGSG